MKNDGESSFTLTAQDKHGIYDGVKIRKLTPTECMRLQGFPDDWCDEGFADTKFVSYKKCGNIEICNQTKINKIKNHSVQFKVVKENKKPISVIVLCTIRDGKEMEAQKKKLEQTNTIISANIAIELSEKSDVWECVTNITKCTDSIKTHYMLKKSVQNQVEMDIYEKQTESIPIEKLWKNTSEENSLPMRLSTILTAINLITDCLIFSFAQGKSMQACIKLSQNLSKTKLVWEVSFLKTRHIEKISDSVKYKVAGNAVTVNVVREIMKKLL